jgi:hypothetical protein
MLSVEFQRDVVPKLTELSDDQLWQLAGILLGCGGRAPAEYIAGFAFRRICGQSVEATEAAATVSKPSVSTDAATAAQRPNGPPDGVDSGAQQATVLL